MNLLDSLRWLASQIGQWAWKVLTDWILPPSWVEAMGPDRTPPDGSWSMEAVLDAEGEALLPGGHLCTGFGGSITRFDIVDGGRALDVAFPIGNVDLPTMAEISRRYGPR